VDVFQPGPGEQLHDLNPTFPPPTGLFWTVAIPPEGVELDMAGASATLQATNLPVLDFGDIPNALSGARPPTPASVSFRVQWRGSAPVANIRVDSAAQGRWAGELIRNTAQMEWSAQSGPYQFSSAPMATSSSSWAEMGQERNGIFF